jgi:hypothetical protein
MGDAKKGTGRISVGSCGRVFDFILLAAVSHWSACKASRTIQYCNQSRHAAAGSHSSSVIAVLSRTMRNTSGRCLMCIVRVKRELQVLWKVRRCGCCPFSIFLRFGRTSPLRQCVLLLRLVGYRFCLCIFSFRKLTQDSDSVDQRIPLQP